MGRLGRLTVACAAATLKAGASHDEDQAHMLGLLHVTHGPDKGRAFSLPQRQKFLIGRGPQAQASLNDPQVSRFHCQLVVQGDKVLLYDSGSIAGTWVNGERITQHELQPGDIICVGETQLSFQWSDVDEQRTDPYDK
jgi:pSer/pThr/pTyr-binding forkhead associated (FHA) protein